MLTSLKFACWAIYTVCSWTLVPLFAFAFRHSKWKDRPFDFARICLEDATVVKVCTDAGQAAMLVQLRGTIEAMANRAKGPTQEDLDWGMKAAILHDSPEFKAAVQAERHYPMSQEACNEFLESLHGATITRAEMMTIEVTGPVPLVTQARRIVEECRRKGEVEEDHQEHLEVITDKGMFCICAPDIGFSYTKERERKC